MSLPPTLDSCLLCLGKILSFWPYSSSVSSRKLSRRELLKFYSSRPSICQVQYHCAPPCAFLAMSIRSGDAWIPELDHMLLGLVLLCSVHCLLCLALRTSEHRRMVSWNSASKSRKYLFNAHPGLGPLIHAASLKSIWSAPTCSLASLLMQCTGLWLLCPYGAKIGLPDSYEKQNQKNTFPEFQKQAATYILMLQEELDEILHFQNVLPIDGHYAIITSFS